MLKSKKSLLVIALIAILISSMFILTGCGNEKETTTQESTGSSQESTTSTGSSDSSSNTVVQVPMAVANLFPNTTITELYLSGAGQNSWGSDLLAGQTMPTGTQLTLMFNIDKDNVKWDIKAVDETGTPVEFRNIDLSNVNTSGGTISLTADESGSPVAVAQ